MSYHERHHIACSLPLLPDATFTTISAVAAITLSRYATDTLFDAIDVQIRFFS